MLPLHDLQARFVAALFGETADGIARWIVPDGIDAEDRVGIYRHNLHAGFSKTLALEFPVIEKLVGRDYFGQLARDFLDRHPSGAGNLHHIGQPFPSFLHARFRDTQYDYLGAVAEVEWAYQEVLIAVDRPPLSRARLAGVSPSDYSGLLFALHPASRLVRTSYPVLRIWRANREDAAPEEIDLRSGADLILVLRTPDCIEIRALPPPQFALLWALSRGEPLGSAMGGALALDANFDLGAALRCFFGLGVFTDVTIDRIPTEGVST
jgi:hypothetical protein